MMHGRRLAAGIALGAWMACTAQAQQATLPLGAAERCLTLTADAGQAFPAYPFEQFKGRIPGRVLVELRFSGPDAAPSVRVIEAVGGAPFESAVRAFVRELRTPCLMPDEGESVLRIDYRFQSDERRPVSATPQADAQGQRRREQIDCVVHSSGQKAPEFPWSAVRRGVVGRVLAELRFTAADKPPQAKVLVRPSARRLKETVESWVSGLRMPCMQGEPFNYDMVYEFLLDGQRYGFTPGVDLQRLLGWVPIEYRRQLPSDTTAMGCPFALRLHYRQPDRENEVQQLGDYRIERQPMLQWLQRLQLQLPGNSVDSVYGDSTEVDIPCYVLPTIAPAPAPAPAASAPAG